MRKLLILLLSLSLVISFVACDKDDSPVSDGTEPPVNDTGASVPSDTTDTEDGTETGAPVEIIEPFDYMANDLSPYITLGQYEGLTVTVDIITLTDEEYAAEVESLLAEYAYTPFIKEDRPSVSGDNLNVDYEGFINGEAVNGTAAKGDIITIAENSGYIPGFVEGFIGHNIGETFSFDVTFPEDYGNSDLAGVTVTFQCKINGIYDGTEAFPPTIEEFVAEFTDFETVEEFHKYHREILDQQLYQKALASVHDLLWKQIIDNSTYHSFPEEEVTRIYNTYTDTYKQYAEMYGVDYDTFLSEYVGTTDEELHETSRLYVREDLTLYQLVKELEVEISDEEYQAGCELYAQQAGVTVDQFLEYYDEDTIKLSLLYEKVLMIISDSAEVIENK